MKKLEYETSRTTIFMDAELKDRIQAKIAKRNCKRRQGEEKMTFTSWVDGAGRDFVGSKKGEER
jgi:hypothetical protein